MFYFSLSLSLCFSPKVFGQASPFLKELSKNTAGFTVPEQRAWDSLLQSPKTLAIRLVEVGALPIHLSGDQLDFHLPGTSDTLHARGLYLEHGKFKYTWWGELPNTAGYVGMAADTFGKLVYIRHGGDSYMIHPISKRYNAQVKMKPDTTTQFCATEATNPDSVSGPGCEVEECQAIINALILITPEAIKEIASYDTDLFYFTLYTSLGPQTLNFALLNSGLTGKNFRFVTEVYDEFDFDEENYDIYADLQKLEIDSLVSGRMGANAADMVILLTDTRYGNYGGIASVIAPRAIVAADYVFSPRYDIAHETGHLLGALHNIVSNGGPETDTTGCNHGYRVGIGPGLYAHSIMAQLDTDEGARVLYFSNPNTYIFGVSLGNAYAHNAAFLTTTFCAAADYLSSDELGISISGPTPTCQPLTYSITIDPPGSGIPGAGPYTYKWYSGTTDPYTNPLAGELIGTASSVTIDPSAISEAKFWLYASAHSSDGVMATSLVNFDNPCGLKPAKTRELGVRQAPGQALRCYPNPTTDMLNLFFSQQLANQTVDYIIFNTLGQPVQQGAFLIAGNQGSLSCNLPAGAYNIQVNIHSQVFSRIFFIQP